MILNIQHVHQLDNTYANDCAQADVLAIARYYSGTTLTLDKFCELIGLVDNTYTSAGELCNDAMDELLQKHFSFSLIYTRQADLAWYDAKIAEGIPAIALCNYAILNPPHKFNGSHFCLVIGTDSDFIYVNDPLRLTGAIPVPRAQFYESITSMEALGNANTFAIYPKASRAMVTLKGVNITPRDIPGPIPAVLNGFDYVRFPVIIKLHYKPEDGQETNEQARVIYDKVVRDYAAAGINSMLVVGHQIGLEGRGHDFENPPNVDWQRVRTEYLAQLEIVVLWFIGLGNTYQIFNEQDSTNFRASVIIPPVEYGKIFKAAYKLIKALDPTAQVITGGYNSGAVRGIQQYRASNIQPEVKPDAIAFHFYGASANGMYQGEDTTTLQVQLTQAQALGLPVILSEYGALGWANEPVEEMAQFLNAAVQYCAGRVAFFIYFSWFPQDVPPYNSYPVVNADGTIRQPIFNAILGGTVTPPGKIEKLVIGGASSINLRPTASTEKAAVGYVQNGTPFIDSGVRHPIEGTSKVWYKVWAQTNKGWQEGWLAGKGWGWFIGKQLA